MPICSILLVPQIQTPYSQLISNRLNYMRKTKSRRFLGLNRRLAKRQAGVSCGFWNDPTREYWRVDPKRELGGYWDFGGNQSPVTVMWSDANQAALDATISENYRRAARESDPDCEGCVMEMGGGRLIAQAVKTLVRGRSTSRLDRALRARGAMRGVGTHAHHIVARKARRASLARRILTFQT